LSLIGRPRPKPFCMWDHPSLAINVFNTV
jgi:hypothetical protein